MDVTLAALAALVERVPWRPHPEVWMLTVGMVAGYWWLIRRLAPLYAPVGSRSVNGRQVGAFGVAVVALWAVSDWPLHDLAEEVFLWVHMVEHVTLAFVVVPFIMVGVPSWLWQALLTPVTRLLRAVTHPMIGLFGFGIVFATTHWPPIIAIQVRSEVAHLIAHVILVAAAFLMFWPVLSPLPQSPNLLRSGAWDTYSCRHSPQPSPPPSSPSPVRPSTRTTRPTGPSGASTRSPTSS